MAAVTLKLAYPSGHPSAGLSIAPDANFTEFDYRQLHASKTDLSFEGVPVVLGNESTYADSGYIIGFDYIDLTALTAIIDVYTASLPVDLTDDQGVVKSVVIKEYPQITRHKTVDGGTIYSVRFNAQIDNSGTSVPTVLSTLGPRLFDR